MATERLQVILSMAAGQYNSEARQAAQATGGIATNAKNAATEMSKGARVTDSLREAWGKYSTVIKGFIALKALQALKNLVGGSIQAASDLGESINAVNQVFKDGADRIHQFGKVSAQVAGLSTREFNALATSAGAMLTNMGFGMEQAAQETIRLTVRAGDMASVFNTDVAQSMEAVNSALRGQFRPLTQFGVRITAAEVKARALELGLVDATGAMTKQGQAAATLSLIYEQTESTAGDFLRTSSELANAQRRQAAEMENAQARFGAALIGPTAALKGFAADALLSVQALGLFGDANSVVAKDALRMQEAVRAISKAMSEGRDPFTALADSLLHIAENGELTSSHFEALAAAAGLSADKFEDFSDIVLRQAEAAGVDAETIEELGLAMTEVVYPAGTAGDALSDLTDENEEAAKAVRDNVKAMRDLRDEYLAGVDPIFAASQAIGRFQSAQEKLTEVQKDGKSTAQEIAQAQLDVAQAALGAQGALEGLADGNINQGILLISQALDISVVEAESLLEVLGLLDGKTISTVVDTRFTQSGQIITPTKGGFAEIRHSGGPGRAGSPYLIRPDEEIFVPSGNGMFLLNDQVMSALQGLNTGNTTNNTGGSVTVNAQTNADPHQIAREIEWAQRVSGV